MNMGHSLKSFWHLYHTRDTDQITGDLNAARTALLQVIHTWGPTYLRPIEETSSALRSFYLYLPTSADISNGHKYVNCTNRSCNHGYSTYSGGYNFKNLPTSDNYVKYDGP